MRFIATLTMFLICIQPRINAQPTEKMSFGNMVIYALHSNADINEAKFQKSISELSVKETRSNGLPKIDASIDYKDYLKLPTMILPGALAGTDQDIVAPFGKKHNLAASAEVSQLLFSLEYVNGLKTAQKASEIKELEVEKAEIELFQLLTTEYYNLIAIYKNLEIVQNNMESLNLTRKNLVAMVDEGLALQTELDRIEINYANLEASKGKILTGIQIQTNNIKYIIGMPPSIQLEIDTTGFMDLFDLNLPIDQYNINQFDPNKLTEIQLLSKNVELNELQIKTSKSKRTPTLALYGSYSFQAQREELNFLNFNQTWFKVNLIGIKATIPIFDGFSNYAKIANAQINKELTMTKLNKASRGLNLQYQNSLMNYESNFRNCQIQRRNMELAKHVEIQENLKFKEGITSLTDFLSSVTDHRNAQINYAQDVINMKKSEIELLKNQGLLKLKMNTIINR